MYRPMRAWPSSAVLQLIAANAYVLWGLGALLGIVAIVPRVLELKGQPPESLTVFGITGAILLVTLICLFFQNRLNRELARRLDYREHSSSAP
jgi:hypothetical protein